MPLTQQSDEAPEVPGAASADPVAAVAALDEPTRRRLYDVVARAERPVGRDDAAAQVGVSRGTAAFHLDRLAERGLLEVTFERLTGRTGPGAGRPAKLYRRARSDVAVSLPDRRYDLAGRLLAQTIEEVESSGEKPRDVLARHAHEEGVALGTAGQDLRSVLEGCGYEPRESPPVRELSQGAGEVEGGPPPASTTESPLPSEPDLLLANCPFHEMVGEHPTLVCGMNLHLVGGVLEGLREEHYTACLDPAEDRCCVRLRHR
jgi:predicted ArsR family transcriptional regulator